MKLAIIALVTFVALGSALPADKVPTTRGLKEDFDKFIALLPKDQIVAIAMDYLANDAEVQEAAEYLTSDEFKSLIVDFEAIAEYRKFLNYLQGSGLNVYYYLSKLHEILGLPEFVPVRVHIRRGAGVRGLIDDIKAILPTDEIKALFYKTLESSEAFVNFIDILRGDEFKGIVNQLRANPTFQKLVQKAKDNGVDVQLIIDLLNKIFGWDIQY
ncbi:uncharacterized protein CBL_11266 [Carabus blaptoides fortunei]